MDSKVAEPIVRELFRLWVRGRRGFRLSLRRKAELVYRRFGVRLSKWQVWRLERQFRLGNVWVDEEGLVHRKPRGVVAEQERFISEYYRLDLDPGREVFREAMKRIQAGQTAEQVLNSILNGEIGRLIIERALTGLMGDAPSRGERRLRPQNMLIGDASAYARRLLCIKHETLCHVPMKEHRKLTGEILKSGLGIRSW